MFRMVDLIYKKRQGEQLTKAEINFIIKGYTEDVIPDYQMSALTMAIYYNGMSEEEVSFLTNAIVESGDVIDLSLIHGHKVDKHSTGGVGDKISLIVAPLVATAGIPVAKMSGRGLGHTGGTIDKLESIEGFKVELSKEQFINNVNRIKMAIIGQTGNLTPADKKLYALRDVTATVDSIPLIASSIMSKKIASGADAIVLDVKTGTGAFMKTLDESRQLAKTMVEIGRKLNRHTVAVITDMNQPLGYEIGNANEVREAIDVLMGNGEAGLTEVALTLAAQMTVLGGVYKEVSTAYQSLNELLQSGKALDTFKDFVKAQGGNVAQIDDPSLLPQASYHYEIKTQKSGYIQQINAESIGYAAMLVGAGRGKKEDIIDHAVGITLKKKVGDYVAAGETLAVIHSNTTNVSDSQEKVTDAIIVGEETKKPYPMIYDIIH